jgi:hypothetical protein
MKRRVMIYWLIPAAPKRQSFKRMIRKLTNQYAAASFEPHLTLCEADVAGKALRQVSSSSIRLQVRGIGHSSKFTKTLFVRFRPNEGLRKIISQLGGNRSDSRDPHMSLLYKHLPDKKRAELAVATKLPFKEVRFTMIRSMSCVSPTETQADVRSWRTLATRRLSG